MKLKRILKKSSKYLFGTHTTYKFEYGNRYHKSNTKCGENAEEDCKWEYDWTIMGTKYYSCRYCNNRKYVHKNILIRFLTH